MKNLFAAAILPFSAALSFRDAAPGESVGGRNASSSGENAMLYYFLCNGYVYGDFAAGKERAKKSTGLGFVETQNAEQDSIIYVDGLSGNDSNSGSFKFPQKNYKGRRKIERENQGYFNFRWRICVGRLTARQHCDNTPHGNRHTAGQMRQEVLL